jgi:hypothetical protein
MTATAALRKATSYFDDLLDGSRERDRDARAYFALGYLGRTVEDCIEDMHDVSAALLMSRRPELRQFGSQLARRADDAWKSWLRAEALTAHAEPTAPENPRQDQVWRRPTEGGPDEFLRFDKAGAWVLFNPRDNWQAA